MTSSLRNSLHRRNHKERSQLAHRSKLGLLEKHADYVKRARDYHSKQDRLTRLKQKAAERNKDEFYFSMTREKTQKGVHVKDRGNVALPTDMVKLLKTQDENYVRTMRAAGLKKIDKIKSQLMAMANLVKPAISGQTINVEESDDLAEDELQVLFDAGIISERSKRALLNRKPGHIVFVDNIANAHNYMGVDNEDHSSMPSPTGDQPVDLGWKRPMGAKKSKKRRSVSHAATTGDSNVSDHSDVLLRRRQLLKELSARLTRDQHLRYTEREFEMQRLMMGKGARKRVSEPERVDGDDEEDEDEVDARKGKRRGPTGKVDEVYKPRIYKWRPERKK